MLALSVVIGHSTRIMGFQFVDGVIAVKTFYIISGFYMALILNEKYTGKGSYKLFLSNRFLRLYPSYYAVAFLTVISAIIIYYTQNGFLIALVQQYVKHIQHLSIGTIFFLILTQFTILGQDIVLFLGLNPNGTLYFTSHYNYSNIIVNSFMLLPQAWSISVELMFYLVAPFIVRKNIIWILGIMFLSFILKLILLSHGYVNDPWNYRFFPTEILFFLSGCVAYKVYCQLKEYKISKYVLYPFMLFLVFATVLWQYIPISYNDKANIYYLTVVLCIPFAFIFSNTNKIDQKIGNLSYPIYIAHILVITILSSILYYRIHTEYNGLLAIIISVMFALVLIKYIEEPIYKIRQSRIKRNNKIK